MRKKRRIYVFDKNFKLVEEYSSAHECAKKEEITLRVVYNAVNPNSTKKYVNGRILSYKSEIPSDYLLKKTTAKYSNKKLRTCLGRNCPNGGKFVGEKHLNFCEPCNKVRLQLDVDSYEPDVEGDLKFLDY